MGRPVVVPAGQVKAELCISTSGLNNYSLHVVVLVGPEVVAGLLICTSPSSSRLSGLRCLSVRDLTSTSFYSLLFPLLLSCRSGKGTAYCDSGGSVVVCPGRVMMCKLSNNRQPPLKSQKCRLQGLHRLNWSTKCVCSSVSSTSSSYVCSVSSDCDLPSELSEPRAAPHQHPQTMLGGVCKW